MGSVNKVLLVGNLGRDIELRYTSGGTAVGNLGLATTDVWTDKNGQRQEKTEWHRVVCFGRTAENVGKFLSKGRQVCVEGKLRTNKWQDKEGRDRWTTEVIAFDVKFLGGREGGSGEYGGGAPSGGSGSYGGGAPSGGGGAGPDEDIPF